MTSWKEVNRGAFHHWGRLVLIYFFFPSELDGDVASVKAVYEKTKEKNIQLPELSLKSLAAFLKKAGEPVPFTEPPVSIS